jgi:hypothetical protein
MVRVSGSGIGSGECVCSETGEVTISGGVGFVGVVDELGVVDDVGAMEEPGVVGVTSVVDVLGTFRAASGAELGFGLVVEVAGGSSASSFLPTRGCQELNRAGLSDCLQSRYWTFGSESGSAPRRPRFIST